VIPEDPLAYVFSLERLGMKFGLHNISALCAELGHPERSFDSVIVAGTNGKGSVTAMVEASLRAAGYQSARYTSPHLVRVEERFVLEGQEVATGVLRSAAARIRAAIETMQARGALDDAPTFFEATTAIAFDLFRQASIEIAVLEVGLGGRLDATNVVTPLVAAITSIDLDHQAQLGSTLEAIAREKAGVIKEGVPVVCGPLLPAADAVVREVCAERRARMVRAPEIISVTTHASTVQFRSARRTVLDVPLGLPGRHQLDNAAVAIAVLDALGDGGYQVGDDAVREGLAHPMWPGRLERLSAGSTEVILDAAHNPAGTRALASYLRDIGWTGVTVVFGAMHDKDVAGMIEALAPIARTIVCTAPPSPRALAADAVAGLAAGRGVRVEAIADGAAALARACAMDARVVVAGSIFLVGPLRDILRRSLPS
jgi:dihydrofolate synthase/folylpolyglutamate synthase